MRAIEIFFPGNNPKSTASRSESAMHSFVRKHARTERRTNRKHNNYTGQAIHPPRVRSAVQRHQSPLSREADFALQISSLMDGGGIRIVKKSLNPWKVNNIISEQKQQISKRRYFYLAAHRRVVNVLTSNSAFLIFAVLVVWFSHSPQSSLQDVLNC